MRTKNSPIENLQRHTPDSVIFRPYAFDRVEIDGKTLDRSREIRFSLLGVCWSEYASGPSLFMLADAAAEVAGIAGWYGLKSARPRGFQRLTEVSK